MSATEAMDSIVCAAIYPSIGIARVGNSADEFFIGPELPHQLMNVAGGFKDAQGALKRQAARFRIYGLDANGKVVAEITAGAAAEIDWTVHVANTKAAWYNFDGPMDIATAVPVGRRNPDFVGPDRDKLKIDPGPRSIAGVNQSGPQYALDSGTFLGQPVYLGELRTDEAGRLLFLGGRGTSGTPFPQNTISWYANNRGWYDDVSDGPVSAKVTLNGRTIPVEPAWVVTAPPNFAPDVKANITLYDVLFDSYQIFLLPPFETVSFAEDILPLLRRFGELQWVNFGYFLKFGWGAPFDFQRDGYIERLSVKDARFMELRRQVVNVFRDPAATVLDINSWPQDYGDDVQIPPQAPGSMLSVTKTQYKMLQMWAAGSFEEDWNPQAPDPPGSIEQYPIDQQPHLLTRAALASCSGGPFHPGCELTWPMRHFTMYCSPFRIRPRGPGQPGVDYGDMLTPDAATNENGPLYWSAPGDLTRWMALPWQTDSAGCRAGYTPEYDPYLPTFWPARVPNHVLTSDSYQAFLRAANPVEKDKAFASRAQWFRFLNGGLNEQMQQMTQEYWKFGVVVRQVVTPAQPGFPAVVFVEEGVGFTANVPPDRNQVASPALRVRPRKAMQAGAS